MLIRRLLLLSGVSALLLLDAQAVAQEQPWAITRVTVVDVTDGSLHPEQTVLVEGDRIARVGPTGEITLPDDAEVIDGTGRYLIPGLWDMHVHTAVDHVTRQTILPLYVAHGITGVRDTWGDCIDLCGELNPTIEDVKQWRRDIAAGILVGPRIVASGPLIKGVYPGQPPATEAPATAAEARAAVRLMKDRGVDFLKVYAGVSREVYFAVADEAARQGIPFVGHMPIAVRASEAAEAGQRSFEHPFAIMHECSTREDELRERWLTELPTKPPYGPFLVAFSESFSEVKCAALFDRLVQNDTWQVPTLIAQRGVDGWREDARLRYVAREEQEYWKESLDSSLELFSNETTSIWFEHAMALTGAMQRAGVGILAGSDAGVPLVFHGFGLHDELELLVTAGLTEAEALRAATLNPARYLEATDSLGTVDAGKVADLVLLDANPLEDIRNTRRIAGVMLNGRYLDREALDALLADIERAANGPGS